MNILILSLRFILPEVLTILQTFVKNPASLASEMAIITAVRDALTAIINGNTPPAPAA